MEQDHNHQYSYSSFNWTTFGAPKFLVHTTKTAVCLADWLAATLWDQCEDGCESFEFLTSAIIPRTASPSKHLRKPLVKWCIFRHRVIQCWTNPSEEGRKTLWFGIFMTSFHASSSLVGQENTQRWTVYGYKLTDFEILWSFLFMSTLSLLYGMNITSQQKIGNSIILLWILFILCFAFCCCCSYSTFFIVFLSFIFAFCLLSCQLFKWFLFTVVHFSFFLNFIFPAEKTWWDCILNVLYAIISCAQDRRLNSMKNVDCLYGYGVLMHKECRGHINTPFPSLLRRVPSGDALTWEAVPVQQWPSPWQPHRQPLPCLPASGPC